MSPPLGELVRRLDRAIGPMPPRVVPGDAEPTGLDGLTRRGPYERLLLSEWALADAVPEEFLRRAAAREHLFHELSRAVPRGGRVCTVLFDAGPDQLGGPRLAHLALFVAFGRRAEAAGAGFVWGTLQGRHPDPGALRALLAGRSLRPASVDDLVRWDALLGPPGAQDERWLVAGPGLAAGARDRVVVAESIDEDVLEVEIRRGGRRGAPLALPLPPAADRARWIRDPFRPLRPAPTYSPPPPDPGRIPAPLRPFLRFSPDGHRVLAVTVDDELLGFRLPDGKASPAAIRRLRPSTPGAAPIGIGWTAGGVFGLFAAGPPDALRVRLEGHRVEARWDDFAVVPNPFPGPLFAWKPGRRTPGRVAFLDGSGNLHVRTWEGKPHPGRTDVVSAARWNGHAMLAVPGAAPGTLRVEDGVGLGLGGRLQVPGAYRDVPGVRAVVGPFTLFDDGALWRTALDAEPRPARGAPVAVIRDPGVRRGVAWLSGNPPALSFAWLWPKAEAPDVVAVGVAAAAGVEGATSARVAWLDRGGALHVHDVVARAEVACWRPA